MEIGVLLSIIIPTITSIIVPIIIYFINDKRQFYKKLADINLFNSMLSFNHSQIKFDNPRSFDLLNNRKDELNYYWNILLKKRKTKKIMIELQKTYKLINEYTSLYNSIAPNFLALIPTINYSNYTYTGKENLNCDVIKVFFDYFSFKKQFNSPTCLYTICFKINSTQFNNQQTLRQIFAKDNKNLFDKFILILENQKNLYDKFNELKKLDKQIISQQYILKEKIDYKIRKLEEYSSS